MLRLLLLLVPLFAHAKSDSDCGWDGRPVAKIKGCEGSGLGNEYGE